MVLFPVRKLASSWGVVVELWQVPGRTHSPGRRPCGFTELDLHQQPNNEDVPNYNLKAGHEREEEATCQRIGYISHLQ